MNFIQRNVAKKFLNQWKHPLPISQLSRCSYSSRRNLLDAGQPTAATHPHLMKEGEITPGISVDEYLSRRKRLLELLPEKSIAIVASAPVKMMTDVVPFNFRQDADYSYITGCQQPGGIGVLSHEYGLSMFMPHQTLHDEMWEGIVAGVDGAIDTFKADQAYPISKLEKILSEMIETSSKVFHNVKTATTSSYMHLDSFRKAFSSGKVQDFSVHTHEARFVKSPSELKLIRDTTSIASQALLQSMFYSKKYPCERMLAAKFEYECKTRGAQRMAFNPVVGSGPNGSVIHYSRNDQQIENGDLVLMDAGCEFHGYVSDVTRTWPPCGKFSPEHEELYELILETNKECVALCKPGTSIRAIHNYSVDKMIKGLKELGILTGGRSKSYNLLNPTSIGHYLGMDVHDCTTISYDRTLQPGVVITIEPGVYIPSNFDAPERYQGVGIRIEDDVLITESGHEVLTGSVPKEIKHIETMLNNLSNVVEMEHHMLKAASS